MRFPKIIFVLLLQTYIITNGIHELFDNGDYLELENSPDYDYVFSAYQLYPDSMYGTYDLPIIQSQADPENMNYFPNDA